MPAPFLRATGAALVLTPFLLLSFQKSPAFRFVDVAVESGLTKPTTFGGKASKASLLETVGTGVAIFDFDGDGANDVFIANGSPGPGMPGVLSQLYKNDGHGHFTDVAASSGLSALGWAQAACVGDIDNDGHPDLLVTYYGSNVLYRNLGNGRFEDITKAAHLPTTGTRWGTGCAFIDYDRDGFLDFAVANYVDLEHSKIPPNCDWKGLRVTCGPVGLVPAHNALFHNNRDGTFTDVSEKAGILAPGGRFGLGVIAADLDNDGWPDLYVACDQTPSLFYRNKHDGTFEEKGDIAGVAYNADGQLQAGMGIAVADFDGNGFLDIAKTNFSGDRPSLYRNEDGRFFEDISEQAGLGRNQLVGWGTAFIDADFDGWPDLIMANGHIYPEVDGSPIGETYRQKTLLYRNLRNGKFEDVTGIAGPAFVPKRPSRGLAIGDLDGDARPEVVIVNMNERPALLKNTVAGGNAIAIELEGTKSNRSAIGARCFLTAGGRRQMQEVVGGGSFCSQNAFALYFGLAAAARVDLLEVHWPSGLVERWKDLGANRLVRLREGSGAQ